MGRWAREWKENGRMYSLSRDYNRGGCFLRLGVADLEGKRFSVYIPRGRGERGGWASMADTLRSLGCEESCPNNQKAVVSRTKPNMVKSYVEATKVAKEKERAAAREILLRKRWEGIYPNLATVLLGLGITMQRRVMISEGGDPS